MGKTIEINPVTRIEGHANVRIDLDDNDNVMDARLVVNELRGFEKILTGMEVESMPLVTARICGVCPVSHHLVSARTLDRVFNVEPPPAGRILRELMNLGGFIHSHTLALFVLSGPDLVLGLNTDPAERNIVGIVDKAPDIASKALRLRTYGQRIVEIIGGRGVHPVTAIAGGMAKSLNEEEHELLGTFIKEAKEITLFLAPIIKDILKKFMDEHPDIITKMVDKTYYMGTVKNGKLNLSEGMLRVIDQDGNIAVEFDAKDYAKHIVEEPLDWSYMKPTRFKDEKGEHIYRVNALARINVADGMETPLAQKELEEFRAKYGRPCHNTLMHHHARLIELIYACEKAEELLGDLENTNGDIRTEFSNLPGDGIAHIEAPRGALFHDYTVNKDGIIKTANLIVATQQNYAAINNAIKQSAQYFLGKSGIDLKNSIEFFIRTYDPCLSCATHAVGQMPMKINVYRKGKFEKTVMEE